MCFLNIILFAITAVICIIIYTYTIFNVFYRLIYILPAFKMYIHRKPFIPLIFNLDIEELESGDQFGD